MASLQLDAVFKSFGDAEIIKGVDLEVKDGEFVVFVGPSGCGKSTLLRLIAGLDKVSGGHIRIGGNDVQALSPGERGIAMVFQSYALYPHMTVRENLSFGLQNFKLSKEVIEAKVLEAVRMLAMEPYLERRPRDLSGGQRQRVAIGRAIVRDPQVFLFDEPLSNLDAALRVQTRAEITRLHQRLKATMIYVTHDQVEAMTMADRIAVLNAGKLEQFGTPEELFMHPANRFVARFIGSPSMNVFPAKLKSGGATAEIEAADFGTLTLPVDAGDLPSGTALEIGIRPQHLRPTEGAGAAYTVSYAESIGTETYVYGNMAGTSDEIILHIPDHRKFVPGQVISVAVDPSLVHVFRADTGVTLPARP
ncbi:sn-glycerol-3-phosphate ABC transporter ATP-binding protein UgpC [Devosia sp. FKR38]|uniref:ABC transporter ATP-binding protein n=1 Tax=Devosia sp. FKR38 TaxID=2562312 RepID=UPI0010C10578|nr:sn-glycerol-3-phosphate ABC transporter ATP-binding protein UgpC [Devosia sp. FKR38]